MQGQEGASSVQKTYEDPQATRTPHGGGGKSHTHCCTCILLLLVVFKSLSHSLKIQKGISSARSDDTKSLKGMVLDWILPRDKTMLSNLPPDTPSTPKPTPLLQNVKMNPGFHHPITEALLCPAGFDYKDTV